jgi:hypothetical protein
MFDSCKQETFLNKSQLTGGTDELWVPNIKVGLNHNDKELAVICATILTENIYLYVYNTVYIADTPDMGIGK